MIYLFYGIISMAIIVMLVALTMVAKLRAITKGGKVGRVVNILFLFIVFFTLSYLVGPFVPLLGNSWIMILTAVVFFFGATFVVIVLSLLKRLILQVFEELKM